MSAPDKSVLAEHATRGVAVLLVRPLIVVVLLFALLAAQLIEPANYVIEKGREGLAYALRRLRWAWSTIELK